jgi:hypothetical protein
MWSRVSLDWTVRRGWRRKISIKDRGGAMTKRKTIYIKN